jgi:hypothetical protein
MGKHSSFSTTGALLLSLATLGTLAAVGCGDADDDKDSVSSQSGDLKHPGKKGDKGEVPAAVDAAAPEAHACAAFDCGPDERCEVREVQCIRAPCPPVATCVPVIPEPEDAGLELPSCAATLCLVGTVCVEGPNGAECVAPTTHCDAVRCKAGTRCVESATGAQCVADKDGCDDLQCDKGTHCELETVQCFVAPCPEQPRCVADLSQCAAVLCMAGTHCIEKQVQCIKAPCPPIAECVPN